MGSTWILTVLHGRQVTQKVATEPNGLLKYSIRFMNNKSWEAASALLIPSKPREDALCLTIRKSRAKKYDRQSENLFFEKKKN